ncbi:hypothetical protein ACFX2B_014023 [Malus domestica]
MSKKKSQNTWRKQSEGKSSQMVDQSENPSSPSGQVVLESPTASERSEGKRTNEELQATMIQVLKSMKRIFLETKGEVSRLCTLTGNLQRRLDLEFSTPKEAQGEWDEPSSYEK